MHRLLLLVPLVGCDRLLGLEKLHDDGGTHSGDGSGMPIDAEPVADVPDAPPGCLGRFGMGGAGLFCTTLQGTGGGVLQGSFDTDSSPFCAVPAPTQMEGGAMTSLCLVVANNFTINDLTVTGSRPLVVAVEDTLTVTGTIVAANGGNWGGCASIIQLSGSGSGMGGGGGAGGSFAGMGGSGGSGGLGVGGTAAAAKPPQTVHGGCVGGKGGLSGVPGTSGKGGGAIYLIARTKILMTSTGRIFATGGGGGGGGFASTGGAGGGGGGSGGLIGLDSMVIELSQGAALVANGGGGGGGGGTGVAGKGGNSTTPATTSFGTPPPGGVGGELAQGGGAGAGGTMTTGVSPGIAPEPGGGGGGGGGGAIVFYDLGFTNQGALISPMVGQ